MSTEHRPLTAFTDDACNLGKLQRAIAASALPVCNACSFEGDGVDMVFVSVLTAPEVTTLDGVVASVDTTPSVALTFIAPSKVVSNPVALVAGWQDLGGVRTSIGFFVTNAAQAVGRIVGDCKTLGAGAKLRLVMSNDDTPISSEYTIPDTGALWGSFEFQTNAPPDLASQVYKLQGTLGTATSAEVRFVSMSLLQVG